jgi:hypothetical protein
MPEIECPSCTCRCASPPGAAWVQCPRCAHPISADAAVEERIRGELYGGPRSGQVVARRRAVRERPGAS